jgi:Glycosyltransferase family 87
VSPARRAFRAWLLAAPVFLVCSAVPAGGLFRGRAYVDIDLYGRYAEGLLDGRVPYRDVFVEYPPGAFVVLTPPALVTDDHYRLLFKLSMALVALAGLWCVARLLTTFDASPRRLFFSVAFVAVSPLLLGSVWLNSYDAWPAALTVASLLALVSGFVVLAFALLALAFTAKVYAAVLLLPATLYAATRLGGRAALRGAAAFLTATVIAAGPFVVLSPDGVWSSLRSQLERGLHVESLGASVLLALDRVGLYDATIGVGTTEAKSRDLVGMTPDVLAGVSTVVLLAAVLVVWLAFVRNAGSAQALATSFAAGVAAVLAFAKVLSPQYAEWLLFLVPLAAASTGVIAAALAAAAFLLAETWFHHYARLYAGDGVVWLVLARNLALVACYAALVLSLARTRRETVDSV